MSTTANGNNITVTVDDKQVKQALGDLQSKAPAVLKVAVNRTARQMRKDEISEAEKRYALTTRGKRKLKDFKQKQAATNKNPTNIHRQSDEGHKLDASYFQHKPIVVRMGAAAVTHSPEYHSVQVLKGGSYQNLEAESNRSKGFLVSIHNNTANTDHIAMLRRKLNKDSDNRLTNRGFERWKPKGSNKPQATETAARPGGSSMQRKVWDETVGEATEKNLQQNVETRMQQVIDAAKKKAR